MHWGFRPPDADEPPSPANTMILLTVGFVFAAFILPLLLAGIQSKNKDIAGADVAQLQCQDLFSVFTSRAPAMLNTIQDTSEVLVITLPKSRICLILQF